MENERSRERVAALKEEVKRLNAEIRKHQVLSDIQQYGGDPQKSNKLMKKWGAEITEMLKNTEVTLGMLY